jgi:hypothetical protein
MTQKPDFTLPLAHLVQFCGRHFTLIRAMSWNAMSADYKDREQIAQIRDTADTVHNLSTLGWHIDEYVSGRTSGRALLESCEQNLRAVKAAEARKEPGQILVPEWAKTREAIEEIIAKIKIVEVDGDDIPTTAEHMQNVLAKTKAEILAKRNSHNDT